MKVFVAGATGVLGRRAVACLAAAGHDVTAVARTPAKAAAVRALGARPVEVSLFDPEALKAAVAGHDAIVNLATHIPPVAQAARPAAWQENDRIRTEGSRNLVDAALAAGARVYVQESIAFLYGDHGGAWVDAATTPIVESPFSEAVRVAEANTARFADDGGRGVVLRFGMFWAADAAHTESLLAAARRGILLDGVAPDGYSPTIDVDDAAAAVVAALEAPSGTYDVVAEPRPRREVTRALASAVGRRLRRPPVAGAARRVAPQLTWSQRVSNRRFREATGWEPGSPTDADVVTKVAREAGLEPALRAPARLWLWVLALTTGFLGVYAQFFPRGFYDDFPNGRGWVAADGPYNEHLVRDFGSMNLALAFVALAALAVASVAVARVAAGAYIVFAVPHALYHFRHLEHYDTGDQVGNVVSLLAGIAVACAVVAATRARRAHQAPAERRLVPSEP